MSRLALLAILVLGQSQGSPQDFLAVKEWWGSIDVEAEGVLAGKTGRHKHMRVATFTFRLNKAGYPSLKPGSDPMRLKHMRMWNYVPKPGAEPSPLRFRTTEDNQWGYGMPIEGDATEERTANRMRSGVGAVETLGGMFGVPWLTVDAKEQRYGLEMSHFDGMTRQTKGRLKSVHHSITVSEANRRTVRTSKQQTTDVALFERDWPAILIENQPLPDKVQTLQGNVRFKGSFGTKKDGTEIVVSWSLSPKPPEDVELILEPKDAGTYRDWRPRAGAGEEDPGDVIGVRARLQKRGGGVPETKARRIVLDLSEVTRVPGVCINWPAASDDRLPEPDLKFSPTSLANPRSRLTSLGPDRAVSAGQDLVEVNVEVASYDWGAFALVRARARLEDGRLLEAHLADDRNKDALRLPKSAEDSWIADSWKKTYGKLGTADDSDDDAEPVGDTNDGDGLTLYEEYRGWYEIGSRTVNEFEGGGDPRRKELFVHNASLVDVDDVLRHFERITGLRVIGNLAASDMTDGQVINFNSFSAPHSADQHVVKLATNVALPRGAAGLSLPLTPGGNPPGPPREKHIVAFRSAPFFRPDDALRRARTIIHELCHCCNVYHHGGGDDALSMVMKSKKLEDGTYSVTDESGAPIQIIDEESGMDLTSGLGGYIHDTKGGQDRVPMVSRGGQASGDERCVMCYANPSEFFWSTKPKRLYLVTPSEMSHVFPLSELRLCTGKTAPEWARPGDRKVQWNAPDHKPESHYGPASLGNCAGQILVNDAVTPVPRR